MDRSVTDETTEPRTNWARNLTYGAARLVVPETVAEAQEAVRAAEKLRVVGSRHCFNDIADTTGTHLSLERLRRAVSLDAARRQVTVEGGIRYGDLGPILHERGYALHNLASLPHISVAGATATATHGSGVTLGNLATAVAGIEFINGAGDLVTLTRDQDGDTFPGAPVSLGALGVITRLTLDIRPAFSVRQDVWLDLPVAALEAHFDEIMASGYSVSLFTDWRGDVVEQVWIKSIVEPGARFEPRSSLFGAKPATRNMHPLAELDAINCTEQMGVVGPSYDRLTHFRMGFTPATGDDLQVEYFIPREHGAASLRAMQEVGERLAPLLMIGEVRMVAADDLWLSTCYRQASIVFHFSFHPDQPALMRLLPTLEVALAPFNPRPHWGKLFAMSPRTVQSRYEKLPAFKALLATHDPKGKFRNAFVERNLYSTAG